MPWLTRSYWTRHIQNIMWKNSRSDDCQYVSKLEYFFLILTQKGPNKTPVAAICLTSLITMAFIFIGQVNILAPIVTVNFMLTYIVVDYAYFSVSMSYNLQQNSKRLCRQDSRVMLNSSQPLIRDRPSCYGSSGIIQSRSNGTLLEFTKDMDQLFRPLNNEPGVSNETKGKDPDTSQSLKQRKQKKATKQMLQDSFLLDLDNNTAAAIQDHCREAQESCDKNMQSFSETSHEGQESPSPVAAMEAKQEVSQDGNQHSNEIQNIPSQKIEGKEIKCTDNFLKSITCLYPCR